MAKAVRSKPGRNVASILHLLKQVQYRAYVRLEEVFQPLGVTAVQFRILNTLSARPEMSSAELARLYDVKPQTMIKQIAFLEAKGLIGRRVSKANKRLLQLSLTPEGKACLKECQKGARALERKLLQPLGGEEQDELRGFLSRLRDSMRSPSPSDEERDAEELTREYHRRGVQRI